MRDPMMRAALDELRRRENEYSWALKHVQNSRSILFGIDCFDPLIMANIAPRAHPQPETEQKAPSGLRARRQAMLAAYKKRTGASNRAIYEAAQHTCRKPDFFAWLKGELPSDSSAATSLERFLAGDAPPRPRKKRPAGK